MTTWQLKIGNRWFPICSQYAAGMAIAGHVVRLVEVVYSVRAAGEIEEMK